MRIVEAIAAPELIDGIKAGWPPPRLRHEVAQLKEDQIANC
jgi:hypothetical protein